MRSLTLLRHAKTQTESATGRDFDRELTERGRDDAKRLAGEISDLRLDYDLVMSSPARRAVQTVAGLGIIDPAYDERIYNASTGELLALVQSIPADAERLLLVGHNPGFEWLALSLAPGSIPGMPTCALAEIELAVDDWHAVEPGRGRLVRFIAPKGLD